MTETPPVSPIPADGPNIQDNNVGNRGDVVKHATLVALARLLRARNPGTIRHIETHCFRLTAPFAHKEGHDWHADVARLGSAAAPYARLEAPYMQGGAYRCSAGLVADTLGADCRLLLAEAHAPTRARLSAAIEAEGLGLDALVPEARLLPEALAGRSPLPTLIHVDPFDHPRWYWETVEALVSHAGPEAGQDVLVLAFAYDKHAPIVFPAPPSGLRWVGHRPDAPYSLGLWASPSLVGPAEKLAVELGFESAGLDAARVSAPAEAG